MHLLSIKIRNEIHINIFYINMFIKGSISPLKIIPNLGDFCLIYRYICIFSKTIISIHF